MFLDFTWKIEPLDWYNVLRAHKNLDILHLEEQKKMHLA